MATKKTKSHGAKCPECYTATGVVTPLGLETNDGTYSCAHGHHYTIEQLREALEAAPKGSKTAAADRPEKAAFEKAERGGISGPNFEGPRDEIHDLGGAGFTVHDIGPSGPEPDAALSQTKEKEADGPSLESSHLPDDLESGFHCGDSAALLPNGDMLVHITLPENMVGPVTELAQQDGKTVNQWISENFLFYIESFFTAPRV